MKTIAKCVYVLVLFACGALCAEEPLQEIRVQLATASSVEPIYIAPIQTESPAFDAPYLSQIAALLHYDFNYNGKTKVISSSTGAVYTLKPTLKDKLLSICSNTLSFPSLTLSGDLKEDRRQVHRLADAIYKALFNKEGICSSRILFAYQTKNHKGDGSPWISEIWECDWDGANARQVTHEESYSVTPVFVPSTTRARSDKFIYVSYKLGQPKIYLSSIKAGMGTRVVDLKGNQLLPAISKQRDKIAFISNAAGRTDLFIQPLNPETGEVGKPVQLYSYPGSTQASPTFNADGSKIAFASDKDGGVRIYVIPSTAGNKRAQAAMITKQNRENSCPSWSPDGTKLAYSAKTGNSTRQIWIYDCATQEERQLTSGPGNKENPCWAPDSHHIVFNSTGEDSSELYVVNLSQPEAVRITKGPGKKHYPTWGL
jgi:TolB protein